MSTSLMMLGTRPAKQKKSKRQNIAARVQIYYSFPKNLSYDIINRLKKKKGSIFQSVSSLQKTSAKVGNFYDTI